MDNFDEFPPINNSFLEYAVFEIESNFNNHYNIFHENVIVLVDSEHKIEIEQIKPYAKLVDFRVLLSKDIDVSKKNKLLCAKESTLLIHFKKGYINRIKPSTYIRDLVAFNSNSSKTLYLSGNLYPEYDIVDGQVHYRRPKTLVFSEIEIEK